MCKMLQKRLSNGRLGPFSVRLAVSSLSVLPSIAASYHEYALKHHCNTTFLQVFHPF